MEKVSEGIIRGTSIYYKDKVEQFEISITKSYSNQLPIQIGSRVPFELKVNEINYEAGLRSTEKNDFIWISPDLKLDGKKVRLVDALLKAGFKKNEKVWLVYIPEENEIIIRHK